MSTIGATSYKQTKLGILPRHEVIKLEVEGTKKGLLLLQTLAQQQKRITQELVKRIHKEGFQDILLQEAGQYRTIQVTYSSKEAPHYSRIAEMMKILCDDTEYSIEHLPEVTEDTFITRVIELLSNFQHRFVFIHPFVDYNGRTARMFTSYILMRLSLPIIEIQVENSAERQSYIQALQKADEHNYSYLETIIADALNESLQKVTKV